MSELPILKKIPHTTNVHNLSLRDDYYWVREKDNPSVIDYLKKENTYAKKIMSDTENLQKNLYQEMLGRIKETDLSVPVKIDNYFYYYRTEKGKQYRIYCRKKDHLDNTEEILLDSNALACGKEYFQLGVYSVSSDHKFLAYSIDISGSEEFTLYIKDLDKNKLLSDKIANVSTDAEWAEDNQTIFYSVLDKTKRPYQLRKHRLGDNSTEDMIIYTEKDESYFLSIDKSKDRKFLFLEMHSKVTSEIHILESDKPDDTFRLFDKRRQGIEYYIDHYKDKFYIITNDEAKNFRLMETSDKDTSYDNWKEIIPHNDDTKIEDIELFTDYLAIFLRHKGLHTVRIENLLTQEIHYIEFDEPVYMLWAGSNYDFDTTKLRFGYSSLKSPPAVFDYDMQTRNRTLLKETEVLGGYNQELYKQERLIAKGHDGKEIPISLIYRKDLFEQNGKNPLFLYGYGSYGVSVDPSFSSNRMSLLDRGFVYAIAHIRGGGDLGRLWYEDGKFLNKENTFLDYISCAEHLIEKRYTSNDRTVFYGGSAGGLLMGAVANKRPDLCQVMIADVPFVDLINTMLDESIPLTVTEYEEWGNPNDKKFFDYMLNYSPYDNVKRQHYPHMLITGGLNDPRVQYWEPTKWAAKLREYKKDDNLLLLKINMGAGHSGPSGRYEFLKEIAFDYAFILKCLQKMDV